MRWGGALHPLALALLLTSLVVAFTVARWAPWSGRAPWVVGWGVLAYLAVAVLAHMPSITPPLLIPQARIDWMQLTEEALRHMNQPAALASSGLLASLPRTLAALATGESAAAADSMPLAPARALRMVLEASVASLRQAVATNAVPGDDTEVLALAILHEEYVLGRPNTQIMTRYSISESTFHRHRREGIRALADELARREQIAQS